ncbi:MAG: hypothetical protein ACYDEN_04460, partial [Acidimicrobiales bacterium]
MGWILLVVLIVPPAVAVACVGLPTRAAQAVTIGAGLVSFALAVLLVGHPNDAEIGAWLRVDPLSVAFELPTAFVYLTTAIFSVGDVHPAGDAG